MASLNRVILIGNLTKDPELRVTPSGTSVGTLRLAVNRRPRTRPSGEANRADSEAESADTPRPADGADYFNIVVWGRLAELCQEYLRKGSPIAVDGRLQSRSWETQEGMKRSAIEVVAENVQFLSRSGGGALSQAGSSEENISSPAVGGKTEEIKRKSEQGEDLPEGVPF